MLREKILDILARVSDSDEVIQNPDVELYTQGLLDSFGTVQLLAALEEELNISISITEIDREIWATPNKIITYVEDKQKNEATKTRTTFFSFGYLFNGDCRIHTLC